MPFFIFLLLAAALFCGGLWFAYNTAFRRDARRQAPIREIPDFPKYNACRDLMLGNIERLVAEPYEKITIRSRDGLLLSGKYYAGEPGKPLVLFFHGYRSTGERDASGGFWYCRERGYSLLMADQRAHGESEGKAITFGVRERWDCLDWAEALVQRFGPDTQILLAGVSMGAATVLMAADLPLPEQVKGIWADCGYDTPEGILRENIRQQGYPEKITYFLVSVSARLLAGFRVEEASAAQALRHAKLPVLLIHGEADGMVPCSMAHALHKVCASPVTLLTVPEAEHGISYYQDIGAYWRALDKFCAQAFGEKGEQP